MSAASAPISIASTTSADQLARIRTDDAAAENAMRIGIEQQFGEAFLAPYRQ